MASLLWYLIFLSSAFASPVFTSLDAICPVCPLTICPTVCPEPFLATRETAPSATDAAPVFNTRYRSTIEIVWSCLAIIFASTWICVHPNVAGYKTTKWQKLWKRVKLFALAVFAPELLAVFAFFQWKGCRELHEAFREKAIELNISLDLDTEDRALQSPEIPTAESTKTSQGTLSEPLLPGSKIPPIEGPPILMRIMRYPKRGLEALARAMSFYEVDPQETAWTLTHAHFVQMGGIVFKSPEREVGFKEPKIWNSERPWAGGWTDKDIKNFFALGLSEAAISDRSKASALAKTLVVMQVLWFVVQTFARALEGLPITHLEVVCLAFTLFNVGMYVCWWDKPLDVECPVEVEGVPGGKSTFNFSGLAFALVGGLDNLPVGKWIYSPKKRLYPGLYCYHAGHNMGSFFSTYFSGEHDGALGGEFTLALSFTSATFGALHAIGWSLPSPSHVEHILWQISCLVLVCYPLVPLVISQFGVLLGNHAPDWVTTVYGFGMVFISFCGAIAYIGARFILLVLPFLELRHLPPLAHQTVSWSNFLPHI